MNKYEVLLVALVACLVLALMYFMGYNTAKAKFTNLTPPLLVDTVYVTKPIVVTDTVRITKWIVKHDTVKVNDAKVVTAVTKDTLSTYGILDIVYWLKPIDRFDIKFAPFPREETIITKTIRVPYYIEHTSWYNEPWMNRSASFLVGLGAGIYLTKKFGN